jgi:hypothetical protein
LIAFDKEVGKIVTPSCASVLRFSAALLSPSLCAQYVPVYVMLPLDTVNSNRQINNPQQVVQHSPPARFHRARVCRQLQNNFYQLKNGGVTGISASSASCLS